MYLYPPAEIALNEKVWLLENQAIVATTGLQDLQVEMPKTERKIGTNLQIPDHPHQNQTTETAKTLHVQAAGQMQVQQTVQKIQTNLTVSAHHAVHQINRMAIVRPEARHQKDHIAVALNAVLLTKLSATVRNVLHQTGLTVRVQSAAALTNLLATDRHAVRHLADLTAADQKVLEQTAHHVAHQTDHIAADQSVAKVAATDQQETDHHVVDLTDRPATARTANRL